MKLYVNGEKYRTAGTHSQINVTNVDMITVLRDVCLDELLISSNVMNEAEVSELYQSYVKGK